MRGRESEFQISQSWGGIPDIETNLNYSLKLQSSTIRSLGNVDRVRLQYSPFSMLGKCYIKLEGGGRRENIQKIKQLPQRKLIYFSFDGLQIFHINFVEIAAYRSQYCYCYLFLLQYYVVRWCNWCSRNVTAERTQFETVVLAGYTYNISVRVVTSYGPGRPSQIQKTVPPLSLRVRFAHTSITGRYGGLEVNLSWTKPSSSERLVGKNTPKIEFNQAPRIASILHSQS